MTKRTISILGVVFFILLIGSTFSLWRAYIPFQKKASVAPDIFHFSSLSEQTSETFSIQKGADKKIFIKKGSDWFLNDKKVVFENVRLFFDGLQKAETKEHIAKNPENHKDLGVTKDDGYRVAIGQFGGKTLVYIIGNSTPGETTYYMRNEDSSDVYAVSSVGFYKLSDSVDQWIEKVKEEPKKKEEKSSLEKKK